MKQKTTETDIRLLSVNEVCERLGISRWTLYQLVHRHLLKSVKIGKRRLFSSLEIEESIKKMERYGT